MMPISFDRTLFISHGDFVASLHEDVPFLKLFPPVIAKTYRTHN